MTRNQKIAITAIIIPNIIAILLGAINFFQNRNIKFDLNELKAAKIISDRLCLSNGYCIYEDESLNIPNISTGQIVNGKVKNQVSTYTKGATTTMEFR
ncbi:MAG: hypothetical protein PHQ42_01975 [Patescibacteria group bacterium]|nr:hypothetical protein [Patescibacteria group bacterium]